MLLIYLSFMEYNHVYIYDCRLVESKHLDLTSMLSPLCWYRISGQLLKLLCSLTGCIDILAVLVNLFIVPDGNYKNDAHGLDRIFCLHYHHMICNLGLQGCLMYRFQTNYLIISTAKKLHAIYLRLSFGTVDISSLLCMYCSSVTLKVHTFVTFLRTSFWPTTFCTITMISPKQILIYILHAWNSIYEHIFYLHGISSCLMVHLCQFLVDLINRPSNYMEYDHIYIFCLPVTNERSAGIRFLGSPLGCYAASLFGVMPWQGLSISFSNWMCFVSMTTICIFYC